MPIFLWLDQIKVVLYLLFQLIRGIKSIFSFCSYYWCKRKANTTFKVTNTLWSQLMVQNKPHQNHYSLMRDRSRYGRNNCQLVSIKAEFYWLHIQLWTNHSIVWLLFAHVRAKVKSNVMMHSLRVWWSSLTEYGPYIQRSGSKPCTLHKCKAADMRLPK